MRGERPRCENNCGRWAAKVFFYAEEGVAYFRNGQPSEGVEVTTCSQRCARELCTGSARRRRNQQGKGISIRAIRQV